MGLSSLTLVIVAGLLSAGQRPTSEEVGVALTLDRFDDSCPDPDSGASCPVINIYRVMVRDLRCRGAGAAELADIRGRYRGAVTCRFRSTVTTSRRNVGVWRDEQAMLFLVDPPSWCPAGAKDEICQPYWRAAPLPE